MKFYFFAIYLMIGAGFTVAYEDRKDQSPDLISVISRIASWPKDVGVMLGDKFYENQVSLGRIKPNG